MSAGTVPRLETERLILRAVKARDVKPCLALMADPQVTRHLGDGRPLSRSDACRQLAMLAGHWVLRGFGRRLVRACSLASHATPVSHLKISERPFNVSLQRTGDLRKRAALAVYELARR